MELLAYWKIFRKRLWLVLLAGVLGTGGAIYYAQREIPLYSTTTTLFINPAAPSAVLPYQTTRSVESLANTYSEYMRTRSFARLIANELTVVMGEGEILNALSTQYVRDTQIFRITATHPNPQAAQTLANTAATVLIAENSARQRTEQGQIQEQTDPARILERQRINDLISVLNDEISYYNDQIQSLEAQITALQTGPASSDTDQSILQLRQDLITARSSRVNVLSSMAQAQAGLAQSTQTLAAPVDTAVVVDEAPLPLSSLPMGQMRTVILGLILGLAAGGALAYLLEYLDFTVRTPEELDAIYGIPTQGVIGYTDAQTKEDRGRLVTIDTPRSPTAEAFRALRTAMRMASLDRPIRSLLITSAGPGEGKTFVASNLAVSLAQEGKRVALVDLDLRRPRIHKHFGVVSNPGFTDLVLADTPILDQVLKPTEVPNLFLVTCGSIPPNPSEMLSSQRAETVMRLLEESFDVVIYDSPPAATVTDAVIIAARVDAVLQAVKAGSTRIDLIQRCKSLLERSNARILGTVLNQVQIGDLGYYDYYYYYGGYYQDGQETKKSGLAGLFPGFKSKKRKRRRSSTRRVENTPEPELE